MSLRTTITPPNSIQTTPWTPGSRDSLASMSSQAERYQLPVRPIYRDSYNSQTPAHTPVYVNSSPVVIWNPRREPHPSPASTVVRTPITENMVLSPLIPGRGRLPGGTTPARWLRRVDLMRSLPTSTYDTLGTSTGYIEIPYRPSTPSPLPADYGSWDLLGLENLVEVD